MWYVWMVCIQGKKLRCLVVQVSGLDKCQTLLDGTTYWALPDHITFSDLDLFLGVQQCRICYLVCAFWAQSTTMDYIRVINLSLSPGYSIHESLNHRSFLLLKPQCSVKIFYKETNTTNTADNSAEHANLSLRVKIILTISERKPRNTITHV